MNLRSTRYLVALTFGWTSLAGCLQGADGTSEPGQTPPTQPSQAQADAASRTPPPAQTVDAAVGDIPRQSADTQAPPNDTPSQQPDVESTPDMGPDSPNECHGSASECYGDSECCSGICTYAGNSYVAGTCIDPLPDGAYCEANGWCKALVCLDNVCGEKTCTTVGSACASHSQCCSGTCEAGLCIEASSCLDVADACFEGSDCCTGLCTYGLDGAMNTPGTCSSPLQDGASCTGPQWCVSGVCTDGICGGDPQCFSMGSECWSDSECCGDTFCSYAFAYQPGQCSAKQPDGGYCFQDSWCASGSCFDGTCVSSTCEDPGGSCTDASQCCSGLCTYDGGATPGQCVELCEVGDACLADYFCTTGNCDQGVCAPPAVTFSDVWENVIVPNNCSSGYCHGANLDGGMGLSMADQELAYWTLTQNTVGKPGCNAFTYVVPYQPEQSVLWLRTRPASEDEGAGCFDKMPQGSEGLDPAAASILKAWILAGAPQ